MVTIGDNKDYIRVLLYSYYATITGWGVLVSYSSNGNDASRLPSRNAPGALLAFSDSSNGHKLAPPPKKER